MKKKTRVKSVAMIAFSIAVSQGVVFAEWTAYHDLSDRYSTTGNHANTTVFDWSNRTSELLKISDGTGTGVSVLVDPAGGSDGGIAGTGYPAVGTEAYNEFNGFIDLDAYIYGSGAVPITLSDLDPTKAYEVVIFGNRGGDYTDRYSQMTLTGADSFVNNSTAGATISGANHETTVIMTGEQRTTGQVFRYSDINPGSDGIVVFDIPDGERNYLNAFKLSETGPGSPPPPAPPSYGTWIAGYPVLGATTNLTDDFEPDGMNNLFEYALGGDPTLDDAATKRPMSKMDVDTLKLIYNRQNPADPALIYTVVDGTNLVDGLTNLNTETGASVAVDGFETVTNQISSATESQQFMQLNVATTFTTDLLDFAWSGNVSDEAGTIVVGIKDHRTVTTVNEIVVRAYTNEAMSGLAVAATQTLSSAEIHIARLTLSGLQANTPYYYGVWVDGVQETALNDADNGTDTYVGQFKTFPAEGSAANFSIALSCGHDNNLLNDAVYTTIKNENPLFYLCTGDFFYTDKVASGYDPIGYGSLDQFRGWYARALNSTAYDASSSASLYRALPLVYMWDDHDFGPNDCVGTSGAGAISKLYAHPAYREYVPHYPLTGDANSSIQQAFTVGRVRFILSDLRTDAQSPGTGNTRIGAIQKSWLKEELLKANGTYPLIVWVTTVPWNGSPVDGQDRWASYANERTELADFIKAHHIRGFCALSGDMHGVGIDDGAYTDFAMGGGAGFPILQAGATGSGESIKGGPYNKGAKGGNGQYGLFEVVDNGLAVTAIWTAKNDLNTTVTNAATGTGYPPVGTPITYTFINSFPLIASLSPADDATDIALDTNLIITFNENIQKGVGNLNICRISDDAIEQTIDVTSPAVTVSGTQITIAPPVNLQGDTAYYITLDEGAIRIGSADFPGIYAAGGVDYKKWNFSTP